MMTECVRERVFSKDLQGLMIFRSARLTSISFSLTEPFKIQNKDRHVYRIIQLKY